MMHSESQWQCEDQKASFEEMGCFNIQLFKCSACRFPLSEINRNQFQNLMSSSRSWDVDTEVFMAFVIKNASSILKEITVY